MKLVHYRQPRMLSDMMRHSFNDSFFNDRLDAGHCGHMTHANIIEDENAYRIEIPVPGKAREDIEVSLEKNLLTISGKKEEKEIEDQTKYLRREYFESELDRSFTITDRIDRDGIKATCKNGILSINLPLKKEEVKTKLRREIEVA